MNKPVTLTGPIRGGKRGWAFGSFFGDLTLRGYVEEEYFIEGEACAYTPLADLTPDGKWSLAPGAAAPYRTRFLVRRPLDPVKFNGTVVVEWTNVSGGMEVSMTDGDGLYESGMAYVAASVQPTGIDGFASRPRGLRWWDPERYGGLHIPNDGVGYDIFTQIAAAVGPHRPRTGIDPMGGLEVKKLIATGASQSGIRMMAYLNGVQPLTHAFDGFVPIIAAGNAADFDTALGHPDAAAGNKAHSRSLPTLVRDDLGVPVLAFNTQTEALFYAPRRQTDTDFFRSWEVAGAAHLTRGMQVASRYKQVRDGVCPPEDLEIPVTVSEVDWLPVLDAALVQMHAWVHGRVPNPSPATIEIAPDGRDYSYDAYGNAKGGIRLPEMEVPTARYAVRPDYPLGGFTVPFPAAQLQELYPTRSDYTTAVAAAAQAAYNAGYLLESRTTRYCREAATAAVPDRFQPEVKPYPRKVVQASRAAKKPAAE